MESNSLQKQLLINLQYLQWLTAQLLTPNWFCKADGNKVKSLYATVLTRRNINAHRYQFFIPLTWNLSEFCNSIFATSWARILLELTEKHFRRSRHEIPYTILIKLSILHEHQIY